MRRQPTTQQITWFLDLDRNGQLDLNPPYQRKSVWSPKDRRFFLDTIFKNYPTPPNNYDCIFIDDPIQSLDSINILSTIDLIRSIVVNQKRQIVLSTHDENFHNLLKKKMPSNLFKSKFLELETFGKVKY